MSNQDFDESRKLNEGHSISIKDAIIGIDINNVVARKTIDNIPVIKNITGKKSYCELLRDPRWQRKRLEILQRDNFTCVKCGDFHSNLQVHHKYYKKGKLPWDYANSVLITMCENCHAKISKK